MAEDTVSARASEPRPPEALSRSQPEGPKVGILQMGSRPSVVCAPRSCEDMSMPLDPSTLGSETPRTRDGRSYPDHLRPYEVYDEQFLPLVGELSDPTFDDLSVSVEDPRARAILPRWLSSAEWRGLVERRDPSITAPRRYVLGPHGERRLNAA